MFKNTNNSNIIVDLKDYMFTSKNMNKFTKHMTQIVSEPKSSTKNIEQMNKEQINIEQMNKEQINKEQINKQQINKEPKSSTKNIEQINIEPKSSTKNIEQINKEPKSSTKNIEQINKGQINKNVVFQTNYKNKIETMYKPKQKDSLFWCFYILKKGFFNYEMEINNQYFVVEKKEKFKYIELLRKNKDILKIHKIKPLTELEDDLANKDKISIKTFFALCIFENINILLVNNRKIYELLCSDIEPINIVHRNNKTYEHSIELDPTNEIIQKYRDTYYKMSSFEGTLKGMGSYKLEELIELCIKLNINIESPKVEEKGKQKMTKKDIYNLLVLNY